MAIAPVVPPGPGTLHLPHHFPHTAHVWLLTWHICSHQPGAKQDAVQTTAQTSFQRCSSQLLIPTTLPCESHSHVEKVSRCSHIKMQLDAAGTTSQLSPVGSLMSLWYLRSYWTLVPPIYEAWPGCPGMSYALKQQYRHGKTSPVSLKRDHPHTKLSIQGLLLLQRECWDTERGGSQDWGCPCHRLNPSTGGCSQEHSQLTSPQPHWFRALRSFAAGFVSLSMKRFPGSSLAAPGARRTPQPPHSPHALTEGSTHISTPPLCPQTHLRACLPLENRAGGAQNAG